MPGIGISVGLGLLRRLLGRLPLPAFWLDAFNWNDNDTWSDTQ